MRLVYLLFVLSGVFIAYGSNAEGRTFPAMGDLNSQWSDISDLAREYGIGRSPLRIDSGRPTTPRDADPAVQGSRNLGGASTDFGQVDQLRSMHPIEEETKWTTP